MFNLKKKTFKKIDITLIITVLLLCIYGIVMIKSATLSFGHDSNVKVQILSTILGFIGIFILVLMDYQVIGRLYIPIYVISVLLLVIVLFLGIGEDEWGARSWLAIGSFSFQPAEISKVGIIIFLAKFIDKNKRQINEPITLLKILILAGIPILLILMQPDLGTAVVFIFFIVVMLFIAGLDIKYFVYAFLAGIVSLPIVWLNLADYQKNRILTFINPEMDLSGSGYQAMQSKIAIGSGKVTGRGLFKGVQTQYNYIPEKQTDFIYAVVGEELGFIGGVALIILYFLLLYRLIKIARNCNDTFGSLMIIGFTAMFFIHIWENIGMTIGIMPITGIPLPFMSYGGTFQLINLLCVGIALSISAHKEGLNF